jgi:hypothetical protein
MIGYAFAILPIVRENPQYSVYGAGPPAKLAGQPRLRFTRGALIFSVSWILALAFIGWEVRVGTTRLSIWISSTSPKCFIAQMGARPDRAHAAFDACAM